MDWLVMRLIFGVVVWVDVVIWWVFCDCSCDGVVDGIDCFGFVEVCFLRGLVGMVIVLVFGRWGVCWSWDVLL